MFWDANAGPNRTPLYENLISQFHDENSNIEIEYVGIPWKSAKEKYDVAIASDSTPDVAEVHPKWMANFVARKALLQLDDYFNAWEDKDMFVENFININREIAGDGNLYQIPKSANTNVIWYREDVFNDKGVGEVKSWDDFYSSIKTLTSDDMYGFSIRGGTGGIYQLMPYLLAYSGIDYYFNEDGKVFLREDLVLEGLNRFVDMYNKYTPESDITNGYKEMVATFDTGKAAMIQHNLGSFGEHSKTLGEGKFAAMPLPLSADNKRIILAEGATGVSVFANTKSPDASWKFLSYLCNKNSISYWNENIGQLPTRTDVNDDAWLKEQVHIGVMADALAQDNVTIVRDSNYLPGQSTVMSEVGQPNFQALLLGEMSPEDFIKELSDAFEAEYQEYIKNK